MFYFTHHELDLFLTEDVPYHDMTTEALAVDARASIAYFTRQPGVVCGTEEVRRLAEGLGIAVGHALLSGSPVEAGQELLEATGGAGAVFTLWKVGQNILDRASGIASEARAWRERLDDAGFGIPVLITRKTMPGAKKLMTKAAMAGGAVPHRLGTSETLLFFDQHVALAGGRAAFLERLPHIRRQHIEKKIIVETGDEAFAAAALRAGADGIQFDKLPVEALAGQVRALRQEVEDAVLLAAGGITQENCARYAAAGIDGVVTSAVYQAAPLDVGVRIYRIDG